MENSLCVGSAPAPAPDAITYSAAITACARLADWQRAQQLKDQMLARWVGWWGQAERFPASAV